jgi:uncharacterized protein YjaG (DUF416 family)
MVKELLYKWFGLDPTVNSCKTCEVLRLQLDESNRERKYLLDKLLDKQVKSEPVVDETKELQPIKTTHYVPWRVRRELLEAEDREKARLLQQKKTEIEMSKKSTEELEKELQLDEEGA